MKVLIIYDSVYGNTEQIAKSIGSAFDPAKVAVIKLVSNLNPDQLQGVDLLIVGAPTQGGRPTKAVLDFLNKIPKSALEGIKVAAFDTRLQTKLVGIFGYAAGKIADSLKKSGGTPVGSPGGFLVKGSKGPLKEGELERAAQWAKGLI